MDIERLLYLLQLCIDGGATEEDEKELFARLPFNFTYEVPPCVGPSWERLWARIQEADSIK